MPYPKYYVGEPLHEGSDLVIVDAKDLNIPIGHVAKPINRGATGVVWKVKQANIMFRAVKILSPENILLQQGDWNYFVTVFEREMYKLAHLTHSHLVKLISFGRILSQNDNNTNIPYIVMEYVEGEPLHLFIQNQSQLANYKNPGDIILDLFDDVLSALLYMHKQNGMHSDIKEMNILVRHSHRPEAVLVDLGAAHIFESDGSGNMTTYITSQNRVSKEWGDKNTTKILSATLKDKSTYLDLYMFGTMLKLFLDESLPENRIRYDWQPSVLASLIKHLDQGVGVLRRIANKCIDGLYSGVEDIKRDLAASRDKLVSPLGVAELSMGTGSKTSLTLPEYLVPFTKRMTWILNHPTVQRLRNISQLDFVNMIYLGATHNRLLHSVETYNLVRRYLGTLLGDPIFRAYCGEHSKLEATLLAGFLHDLGHYPLGHIFEDFAFRGETSGPYTNILRDEKVTSALLGNTADDCWIRDVANEHISECCKILRTETVSSLSEMIQKEFGEQVLSHLQRILSDQEDEDKAILVLRSIVNGPLDVDKVCYLRTDSRYTGATYGSAIDVNSILGSLTCTVEGRPGIAITEKGICAAESIATGRRWMYQRVYWHRTNRAIMAMIRFALQYLLEHEMLTFAEYFKATYSFSDVEAIKWVNNKFKALCEDDNIENPANMIIDGRRGIYKVIHEFSPNDTEEEQERIRLYLMGCPCEKWSKISAGIASLAQKYAPETKLSDVLIDIPSARRHQIGDITINPIGDKKMLSAISAEFRCTREFFEKGALSCRIFIHPTLRQTLVKEKKLQAFKENAYSFLKNSSPR